MTAPATASPPSIYETPWPARLEDAWFYHKIDLPGIGEAGGDWDLRQCASAYLGNVDFTGKRVLDVGAASGFLTFEMEKRGAEVVSFDIEDGANWDVVPHYKIIDKLPHIRAAQSEVLKKLKTAYWVSHKAFGSRARAHYGNIYAMDDRLGEFDAVFYGMIISHLQNPFQALYQGAKRCRKTMIVASMFDPSEDVLARFIPRADDASNLRIKGYWIPSYGLMREMLGVLGFKVSDIVPSVAIVQHGDGFKSGETACQTVVAHRI